MKVQIAGLKPESIVDGPGIRYVIFFQGCPHRCFGCHNPNTHDYKGGKEFLLSDLLDRIKMAKGVSGVTFTGGEPLLQIEACLSIAKVVKEEGKDLLLYSGYLFEKIWENAKRDASLFELIKHVDILIDGPFLIEKKELPLPFRGSKNQRVIDVKKTIQTGKIIEKDMDNL